MSISYFITPYDPKAWKDPADTNPKPTSDLRIDLEDFAGKLKEHWPGLLVEEEHPIENLHWTFPLPPEIEGYFAGAGGALYGQQIISLTRDYDGVFQGFLLWYRAYVPATYRLWFFNSSSWDRLELTRDTSEADILGFRRDFGI